MGHQYSWNSSFTVTPTPAHFIIINNLEAPQFRYLSTSLVPYHLPFPRRFLCCAVSLRRQARVERQVRIPVLSTRSILFFALAYCAAHMAQPSSSQPVSPPPRAPPGGAPSSTGVPMSGPAPGATAPPMAGVMPHGSATPFVPRATTAGAPQPQLARRAERARANSTPGDVAPLQGDTLRALIARVDRRCQTLLDRVAPYKLYRWLGLAGLLCIFLVRMLVVEGFYIVAYVLFIFILNQFILFLQPKDRAALVAKVISGTADGAADDATSADRVVLPTLDDEEFRPFVRRLPEFQFWYSSSYATVLSFCATFYSGFDVPVFWPLLLFYFILLFVATMRRQWLDMKKLKYVPWDIGNKKVYRSDPKRVSVAARAQNGPSQDVASATARAPPPVPTIQVAQKKAVSHHAAPSVPAQS